MYEIRRKLRSQRGVTVVFALVIFLIMALFSYVMVNASLTAVQGAHASQVDEQAALSTSSVAFIIRDAMEAYPEFTVTNGVWANTTTGVPISGQFSSLRHYVDNQLQKNEPSVWRITNVSNEVKEKFGFVRVTMDANFPAIIVRLEHCDYDKSKDDGYNSNSPSNYNMTVTITGTVSPTDSNVVTFQNSTIEARLGVS